MKYTKIAGFSVAALIVAGVAAVQTGLLSGGGGFGAVTDEQLAADTFVGITAEGTAQNDLYGQRTLSVDVSALNQAATEFVASLSDAQRAATLFEVDALEWRKWSNVDVYQREGTSLADMSEDQKTAAWALLNAALSDQGIQDVTSIMHLNLVEGELLGATDRFHEDLYWFTVMGTPGDAQWGFQLDGHHMVINIAVNDGQVTMTPAFLGSEPTTAPEGTTYAGETVLQSKQNTGLALAQSLSAEQLAKAVLEIDKTKDDMIAGAFADNVTIAYEGLPVSEMSDAQQTLLLDVVETYTGNLEADAAAAWMAEIIDHLDETWFAWVGNADADAVFYYRIYSPVLLIEFDHQRPGPLGQHEDYKTDSPTREHIHSIIRAPNGGDYGDILRQHLSEDHSH